jgi:hypothetical protein
MLPERVEKLRLEYSDQYVVVEGDLPELAQFRGKVGQVWTINVNGRALVEFESDRGRYDLELDYLKVVDKPKPKAPPAKAAKAKPATVKPEPSKETEKKAEPKEKLSELELARQKKDAEKRQRPEATREKADQPAKKP